MRFVNCAFVVMGACGYLYVDVRRVEEGELSVLGLCHFLCICVLCVHAQACAYIKVHKCL